MAVYRLSSAPAPAGAALGRPGLICTILPLAALMLSVSPATASASLIVQVQDAAAPSGGTGSFDLVLADTAGSFQVSGFSVELSVPTGSGVTFTGAGVNTTIAPYVFATLQQPPLTFATFPTTDFTASDSDMSPPGFVSISAPPAGMLGLEHVTFAVASGTSAGTVPVSIMTGVGTQILELDGTLIPFAQTNGTITVGTAAVPEPSSMLPWAIAAASLGVLRCRRRAA